MQRSEHKKIVAIEERHPYTRLAQKTVYIKRHAHQYCIGQTLEIGILESLQTFQLSVII